MKKRNGRTVTVYLDNALDAYIDELADLNNASRSMIVCNLIRLGKSVVEQEDVERGQKINPGCCANPKYV